MSETEFLDADELQSLTAFKWTGKQQTWLRDNGIPFRVDGRRVIVSRRHVRDWLEGRPAVSSNGPNWSAVA